MTVTTTMVWGSIVSPRKRPETGEPVLLEDCSWPEPIADSAAAPPDLASGIRGLYQKCHLYDVFLVCGQSRFPAHQAVLAAASAKLREMLLDARAGRSPAGGEVGGAGGAPPPPAAAAAVEAQQHLELRLPGSYTAATLGALLDFIYSLGGYSAASDEANVEVLRLAAELELPELKAQAARWLGEHLAVANAIPMLAVCEEFGLADLCEQIKERLTSDTQALLEVSQQVSARTHPEILQSLLMRMATKNARRTSIPSPVAEDPRSTDESAPPSSPEKREAPPAKQAAKRMAKKMKS